MSSSLIKRSTASSGFTLLELTIVLIVIGLVTGGILMGRDLIKLAAIRKLGGQIESYDTAAAAFRAKYAAIPGDMADAEAYFGTDPAGCPAASNLPAVVPYDGTCNGNGDGQITFEHLSFSEVLRFWQMLSNARMIQGMYYNRGYQSAVTDADHGAGRAFPAIPSELTHNAHAIGVMLYWAPNALFTPITTGHIFVVGRLDQNYSNSKPALSPLEAKIYDSKFDDGMPTSGNVKADITVSNTYGSCVNGTNYLATDTYYFTNDPTGTGCPLFIRANF